MDDWNAPAGARCTYPTLRGMGDLGPGRRACRRGTSTTSSWASVAPAIGSEHCARRIRAQPLRSDHLQSLWHLGSLPARSGAEAAAREDCRCRLSELTHCQQDRVDRHRSRGARESSGRSSRRGAVFNIGEPDDSRRSRGRGRLDRGRRADLVDDGSNHGSYARCRRCTQATALASCACRDFGSEQCCLAGFATRGRSRVILPPTCKTPRLIVDLLAPPRPATTWSDALRNATPLERRVLPASTTVPCVHRHADLAEGGFDFMSVAAALDVLLGRSSAHVVFGDIGRGSRRRRWYTCGAPRGRSKWPRQKLSWYRRLCGVSYLPIRPSPSSARLPRLGCSSPLWCRLASGSVQAGSSSRALLGVADPDHPPAIVASTVAASTRCADTLRGRT